MVLRKLIDLLYVSAVEAMNVCVLVCGGQMLTLSSFLGHSSSYTLIKSLSFKPVAH